jgi:acetylornithine deacetylase
MLGTENRVLDAIDVDGMLEYLCELLSIPSTGGEENAAQENVAAKLEDLGLEVEKWEMDFAALRDHPSFSMAIEREEGLGVIGVTRGCGEGRSLILNGHIDVVSAGDESNWSHAPWKGTIADGRVYGRGAADMKGGLCCAIFAAKAIIDSGVRLKGELMIESVIGEEDGGVGTLDAALRGYDADGAVIMEPTELKVGAAHSGALSFMVTVPGRSAHACVREEGVSAIEKFIPVHDALIALERERNEGLDDPLYTRYETPYPINIGKVQGGNWPGSVAESLVFEGRIGVIVGERIEEARSHLEKAIEETASADPWLRGHPPSVEWRGYQFEPASVSIDNPIVTTLSDAFDAATGEPPLVEGMTYASDMRHLINVADTPTLLFGPGDVRRAHSPDEYVPVEDLVAATRNLVLTAMRFCGYEEP